MASKPDILPAVDRGQGMVAMQPTTIGEGDARFRDAVDLALVLTSKSAAFRSSLPPAMRAGLAALVRAMNCYYTNLQRRTGAGRQLDRRRACRSGMVLGADGLGRRGPRRRDHEGRCLV